LDQYQDEAREVYDLLIRCAGINFDTEAYSYLAPKPAAYMADGHGSMGSMTRGLSTEKAPALSSKVCG